MKKATKASENCYYKARYAAAQSDTAYESRENASEKLGIDRTRLARIELGNVIPYPDEVLAMADAYHSPELCYNHCANDCPIGQRTMTQVEVSSFDRLSLKVLGSLNDIDSLKESIINISQDGKVDPEEREEFQNILDSLDKISTNAKALQLWAMKNIEY